MKKTKRLALLLALALAALFLAACGDDDDGAPAEATDAAFVAEMIPHHESAIEMAEVAQTQAEHPEIKQLADDIVAAQTEEIGTLTKISEQLGDDASGGSLGMSSAEMGMDTDASMLGGAAPFDQEFIDMMVPHHQGAILMAREELASGGNDEALALAEEIIATQSQEIEQMNEWRTKWYGSPSPAGGVSDNATATGDHENMGH